MKTKEIINEGILGTIKSKLDNYADFFDPAAVASRNAKDIMIKSLLRSLEQNIRAGLVDPELPLPATSQGTTTSPVQPSPQKKIRTASRVPKKSSSIQDIDDNPNIIRGYNESTYHKLNALFESILEAEEQDKISIYDFLKQESINKLPKTTPQELKILDPILQDLHKNWKNTSQKNQLLSKWADIILVLSQRRNYAKQAEVKSSTQDSQSSAQTGQQTAKPQTSTQNPQQPYTDTLNKQIEKMTTDYKDDIPQIIDTLITRLQQIDSSRYKALIDKIKTLPAGGSTSSPSQPAGNTPTTESVKPKKNKKVSRKY